MISANRYFRVRSQFPLEAKVGTRPANVWIGAARALETTYSTVIARRGDEVHELVGGTFLVRKLGTLLGETVEATQVLEVHTRRRSASELMLHPAPAMPSLPFEKLTEIPVSKATPIRSYRVAS